jgi:D-beta-D-heptose 7-phosphate kinase/D-beta-D-heptose 1-phosphate adenosyltransferase
MITIPWTSRSKPISVAVLGDLMLDEYLVGEVNRISPEAPVPIHLVSRTNVTAGGAANTARNIQLAGGFAKVFGVIGKDPAGAMLMEMLVDEGINVDCVVTDESRPTVRKTRVTAGNHQLLRIDWEKTQPIEASFQAKLLHSLEQSQFDAILISDYGKGALPVEFIQRIIRLSKERGVPCIVDPKGTDFSRYVGCHTVKPNRKEALLACGFDPEDKIAPEKLAETLRQKWSLNNVLVTLGGDGMIFCGPDGESGKVRLAAKAREVFDVSGAGDCVSAVYALGVASGATISHAMQLANLAAGKVVEKWGTQPITLKELEDAIEEDQASSSDKFVGSLSKFTSVQLLKSIIGLPEKRKHKIVFTNGCFDLMHAGHVTYLEAARALGDRLIVGVNSDRSIRAIKGPERPILEEKLRIRTLCALGCVDHVVVFDEDTPEQLIRSLGPNILVKGADWNPEDIVGGDYVRSLGGRVETIELVPGISTSEIVRRIRSK